MGIIDFCQEIKNEEFKASKEAATKILEILNNCDNLEEFKSNSNIYYHCLNILQTGFTRIGMCGFFIENIKEE